MSYRQQKVKHENFRFSYEGQSRTRVEDVLKESVIYLLREWHVTA